MKVDLYSICWNEAEYLSYFFRTFDPVVDRYVIYDDDSDDGSAEILKAHPRVELRRFRRTHEQSFVMSHQGLQNQVWTESRGKADWVIITAIDEHLVLPGGAPVRSYLQHCRWKGVTAIPAIGFQMVCDAFPAGDAELWRTVTQGAPWHMMNKLSVFNPNCVVPEFRPGRHVAAPTGRVIYPKRDRLMLLHYKFMDFQRTLQRQHALDARLGKIDRENRWGNHYSRTQADLRAEWDAFESRTLTLVAPGFRPDRHVDGCRWWRKEPPSPSDRAKLAFRNRARSLDGWHKLLAYLFTSTRS